MKTFLCLYLTVREKPCQVVFSKQKEKSRDEPNKSTINVRCITSICSWSDRSQWYCRSKRKRRARRRRRTTTTKIDGSSSFSIFWRFVTRKKQFLLTTAKKNQLKENLLDEIRSSSMSYSHGMIIFLVNNRDMSDNIIHWAFHCSEKRRTRNEKREKIDEWTSTFARHRRRSSSSFLVFIEEWMSIQPTTTMRFLLLL